jgi:hypothetical protein
MMGLSVTARTATIDFDFDFISHSPVRIPDEPAFEGTPRGI